MKKAMSVFLVIIVILTGVGTADAEVIYVRQQSSLSNFIKTRTYDHSFADISGHWAEEHISNAYEYGIISGMGGDLYDPDGSLTMAQAITIAARLHMIYKYSDAVQDMVEGYVGETLNHWAAPFIAYAVNEGLIDDEWDGAPNYSVTKAETIKIWSRILQSKDMASVNVVNSLPDINLSTPYSTEITLFYEAGLVQDSNINGVPYSFNPNKTLSRAEAAAIFILLVETDNRVNGRTYGEKTVRAFAGTGTSGFSDETTSLASFTLPYGLVADKNGRILVFDTYNNALRLINNGKIETIAGQWITEDGGRFSHGFYRDGVLSEVLFSRPTDGVYNADGELFICDSENHVIRLIRNGKAYTFAGTSQGYANGKGGSAKFNTPMAIAIDRNGNLYVADTMNNCIRKISIEGSVTTIAGVPGRSGYTDAKADDSLFNNPSGIAVSEDGSIIYVADTGNHRIRKIEKGNVVTLSGVTMETDADGEPMGNFRDGAADEAMFNLPKGITLTDDILFVADSGNNAVRAVNMKGHVFTVAGTGEPGNREGGILNAEFNQPAGVLWHNGVLYIADTSNNMIKTLKVDTTIFKGVE